MKKFLAITVLLAVITFGAHAAGIVDIKQKARDVTKPPAPAAAPTAKPAAQPANTVPLPEAQQQNITRLQADLAALVTKTQVTPGLPQQFQKDLIGAVQGPSKPGRDSISRLAEDLSAALTDRKLSAVQQARLAKALHVVLNSAYSPTEAVAHGNDALAILKAIGAGQAEVQAVSNDLKAIAAELQRNAPKAAK